MTTDIKDPQIAPNEAAIVITESEDGVIAATFFGSEIKQNSISYQVVEQLLAALAGVSKGTTLLEDTTDQIPDGSRIITEG